jgi:hypothetical protein
MSQNISGEQEGPITICRKVCQLNSLTPARPVYRLGNIGQIDHRKPYA